MTNLSRAIDVKPIIKYPREAQVGKTYLMTINLQPEEGFEWQYEEEEYPIYCIVDSESFTNKPVGEPVIVLHRFGGSYGEAKFLLTAVQKNLACKLEVVLVNKWGVLVRNLSLNTVQVFDDVIYGVRTPSTNSLIINKYARTLNSETVNERFRQLILEIRETPPKSIVRYRARATNRFLVEVQKLSGLVKSNHQDYLDALNKTLLWLVDNIDHFSMNTLSIETDLLKWINSYLQWRIRDLFKSSVFMVRKELERTFIDDKEEEAFLDSLDRVGVFDSILEVADEQALLFTQMELEESRAGLQALVDYIQSDPDGNLKNIYIRHNPKCNAQVLIQRRIFQEKLWLEISQEFHVPTSRLTVFFMRKVMPLLREIADNFLM